MNALIHIGTNAFANAIAGDAAGVVGIRYTVEFDFDEFLIFPERLSAPKVEFRSVIAAEAARLAA